MDQIGLLGLPSEIIEHICSYLSLFDVAKLEQTNKKMLQTIQGVRVWKRVAERFGRKFNYPLVRALLNHMKENDITDVKYYKIVIGKDFILMILLAFREICTEILRFSCIHSFRYNSALQKNCW